KLIATAGGIGYLPLAPGTWASLAGTILWYELLIHFPSFQIWQWMLTGAAIILGVISSSVLVRALNKGQIPPLGGGGADPSQIVIDEVAGTWIAFILIPPKLGLLIGAFILFRFFDIVKPLGIRKFEKLKGGWGIMMDDVVAGVYSNV